MLYNKIVKKSRVSGPVDTSGCARKTDLKSSVRLRDSALEGAYS